MSFPTSGTLLAEQLTFLSLGASKGGSTQLQRRHIIHKPGWKWTYCVRTGLYIKHARPRSGRSTPTRAKAGLTNVERTNLP